MSPARSREGRRGQAHTYYNNLLAGSTKEITSDLLPARMTQDCTLDRFPKSAAQYQSRHHILSHSGLNLSHREPLRDMHIIPKPGPS